MSEQKPERTPAVNDAIANGAYSNEVQVHLTREEFVLDFVMNAPKRAEVVSRVIMSPPHVKRLATMLANTVKMYETKFATSVPEAPKGHIGFIKPED